MKVGYLSVVVNEEGERQTVEVDVKKTVDSCVGCDVSYRDVACSPIVFSLLDEADGVSSKEVAVQTSVYLVDVAVGQDIEPAVVPASLSVDVNQGLRAKEQPAVMEPPTDTCMVSIVDNSSAWTAHRNEAFRAVGLEMMPHDEEEELITVFKSSPQTSPVPFQHVRPNVVSESEPCPVCHQSLSLFENSLEIC